MSSAFAPDKDGLRLHVRLSPAGSANKVYGEIDRQDAVYLKVSVTAVAEKGGANTALIKLLAKELKVPKSRMSLICGATDRYKVLLIKGDTGELLDRVSQWWKGNV